MGTGPRHATRRGAPVRFQPMAVRNSHASIDSALTEFLADQRGRLSERTFRRYEEVVQLLRHSLDGYAYTSLDDDEQRRWEAEYETNEDGAFCRLFGPEKIPAHLGEFLGYFMVRKVIAGQELLKASGTVTGELLRWLADRGDIDEDASERGREAAMTFRSPIARECCCTASPAAHQTSTPTRLPTRTGSRTTSRSRTSSPARSGSRRRSVTQGIRSLAEAWS